MLANPGKLKIIGRAGVGVDNIDVKAATEKGVLVINTPQGNAAAAAELAIGLMFALSGASLFVYLTQYVFRSALLFVGAPDVPLLNFVAALAGGVAIWSAWTWTNSAISKRLRRQEPATAATAAI